jgi:hypothetical protein
MRVSDWNKWTRFKKRLSVSLLLVGIFISFGMENGSIAYGVWGIVIAGTGLVIFNTIRPDEWEHYRN